jgi:hypothetical protein
MWKRLAFISWSRYLRIMRRAYCFRNSCGISVHLAQNSFSIALKLELTHDSLSGRSGNSIFSKWISNSKRKISCMFCMKFSIKKLMFAKDSAERFATSLSILNGVLRISTTYGILDLCWHLSFFYYNFRILRKNTTAILQVVLSGASDCLSLDSFEFPIVTMRIVRFGLMYFVPGSVSIINCLLTSFFGLTWNYSSSKVLSEIIISHSVGYSRFNGCYFVGIKYICQLFAV